MKLLDKKISKFVIEITPENKKREQELNQSVIKDMKRIHTFVEQSRDIERETLSMLYKCK